MNYNGFGLSTAWNYRRHINGRSLITEIKGAGFSRVELNFTLREETVGDIIRSYRDAGIQIVSLHNFCPATSVSGSGEARTDEFSLSSLKEAERCKAVSYTKRTIDTASAVGAEAVILHCGRVDAEDRTKALCLLYDTHRKDTVEYKLLLREMISLRAAYAARFVEAALRSVSELVDYARGKGIRLGIENRYYYMEIPSLEEIRTILSSFDEQTVGYWHDAGHGQVMENLGFAKHDDFLKNYSDRMVGAHIHDIVGVRDHKPPLTGSMDFVKISRYIGPSVLKILEIHSDATIEQIRAAAAHLEQLFGCRITSGR
jgi:sugar phosphate isomerase/epimerase